MERTHTPVRPPGFLYLWYELSIQPLITNQPNRGILVDTVRFPVPARSRPHPVRFPHRHSLSGALVSIVPMHKGMPIIQASKDVDNGIRTLSSWPRTHTPDDPR
jgi:hypothetical protein